MANNNSNIYATTTINIAITATSTTFTTATATTTSANRKKVFINSLTPSRNEQCFQNPSSAQHHEWQTPGE